MVPSLCHGINRFRFVYDSVPVNFTQWLEPASWCCSESFCWPWSDRIFNFGFQYFYSTALSPQLTTKVDQPNSFYYCLNYYYIKVTRVSEFYQNNYQYLLCVRHTHTLEVIYQLVGKRQIGNRKLHMLDLPLGVLSIKMSRQAKRALVKMPPEVISYK